MTTTNKQATMKDYAKLIKQGRENATLLMGELGLETFDEVFEHLAGKAWTEEVKYMRIAVSGELENQGYNEAQDIRHGEGLLAAYEYMMGLGYDGGFGEIYSPNGWRFEGARLYLDDEGNQAALQLMRDLSESLLGFNNWDYVDEQRMWEGAKTIFDGSFGD